MKTIFLTIVMMICSPFILGALEPQKMVFVISPFLNEEEKMNVQEHFLQYLFETANPKNEIILLDGWSGSLAGKVIIPKLRYDNPNARSRHMGKGFSRFLQWFNEPAEGAPLQDTGALQLPKLLSRIERYQPDLVLFVGSPIYFDLRNQAHNWMYLKENNTEYYFPSDGFFFAGSSSPWTVDLMRARLSSSNVHWLLKGNFDFPNLPYETSVKRFYSIYLGLEGGKLVSFLDDTETVFSGLTNNELKPFEYQVNRSDNQLIMRKAKGMNFVDNASQASVVNIDQVINNRIDVVLPQQNVQKVKRNFEQTTHSHDAAFAISWESSGTDLDLWAFEKSGNAVSYRYKRSQHGQHLSDKTSGDGQWESIVYDGALPSSIWVNCYALANNTQPIRGLYFYRINGQIIEGRFELAANARGDRGKVDKRHNSSSWLKLNIPL